MRRFLRAYGTFLRHYKRWWLIPLLILFATLAGIVLYFRQSTDAPFVYAPF